MENLNARIADKQKRNVIHIEYCTNCQSHNWNTHHNQAKYHQTYIKLKNLIEESFKQNSPMVTANKVSQYLTPIKEQQNKYYNQLTKKYMFFPNIGSFQITLNDEPIFSKKKTNNWPCFETVLNDLSMKMYSQPFETKLKAEKKEANQSETDFSSDQKLISQGYKTLYKNENKNMAKNFGKFTLTDHFKSFHQQIILKAQEPKFYFDSSSTIRQSPEHTVKKNINVQDIDGLRRALRDSTQEQNERNSMSKEKNRGNEKQILINLCSIEEESNHIKEIAEFRASNSFKKKLALVNTYPTEIIPGYNNSEKSLSLKRFQELNNDLRKIEKQFQHIQKKMIINGQAQQPQNDNSMDESRLNNQCQENQHSRNQSQSGFVRSKFHDKENFISHHLERYSKESKLSAYISNIQNSQIKATDRYDERYIVPTYYEENELFKNVKSKKFSEIEKYLKANNEEKNKKLKKIYGDWKVGSNANYFYYIENGKKVMLRDSTNISSQSRQKMRIQRDRSSLSSSESTLSAQEKDQFKNVETKKNQSNHKDFSEEGKIKKHSSFIIKNKSLHKNVSNSAQKLSKYSLNEKILEMEANPSKNINLIKNDQQGQQQKQLKQAYMKQNSKSFQVNPSKSRSSGNPFMKREKYSMVDNLQNFHKELDRRQNVPSRQSNRGQEIISRNGLKQASSCSKSKSCLSVSNTDDPSQRKISQSSVSEKSQRKLKTGEQLPKIEEAKQIQMTEQSVVDKCENKIIIEFHEFQLKLKSSRQKQQVTVEQKKQEEAERLKQKVEKEKSSEEKSNEASKQDLGTDLKEEQITDDKRKDLTISREVYVQLDLQEMSQSQIMKTKQIEQKEKSSEKSAITSDPSLQCHLKVPIINLKSNKQDPIQSSQAIQSSTQQNAKSKSCSSNCLKNSEKSSNKNFLNRSSSLYGQPTFSHAISHNLLEQNHCKCEQRIQQLETNRIKIESQRKEKQIIKEKKYEETQRRKEMLAKEKEEYLKQLQIQMQEKQRSTSNRKNEPSPKSRITLKRSLQRQTFSKDAKQSLTKEKRVLSHNVEVRKSPQKSKRNQKPDEITEQKKELDIQSNSHQNKPAKSMTQTLMQKPKKQVKKTKTVLDTNSKGKSSSKNTFTNITSQPSQQVPKDAPLQNIKKEMKESKSISQNQKQTNLTRKANNHRNKSYFMAEKQGKFIKSNTQVKNELEEEDEKVNYKTQNRTEVQIQVSKEDQRSKLASIAIQTMQFEDLKKYSKHQENQNAKALSKRNKSIQSRNSSVPKSGRQSVKSGRNNQIIKEVYSPIQIQVKGGETKVKKSKRENKLKESQFRKNNKSKSKSKRQSQVSSLDRKSSEKQTIVKIFENQQNDRQLVSEDDYVSYRGQRQKALILKQLYNMDEHLSSELKLYESLYQENKLYQTARQQVFEQPHEQIFQILIQEDENQIFSDEDIIFTQVENCYEAGLQGKKLSLFGSDSVQIHNLKSNQPYLTRNLHKVLHIICEKNELLIVKLFEDYKSQTNFFYTNDEREVFLQKYKYGVWLCINKTWKLILVDNIVPVREDSSQSIVNPLFSYHQGNQLWPQILQKCLAQAVGGYHKLFQLSIGELFSILTGSNNLAYTINENLSKNKLFLKEIAQNDKKNFIMVCEKYSMNLKEQNQKTFEVPKVFYLISKKIVQNGNCCFYSGQNEEILFKMRESIINELPPNSQPYYVRYDNFCSKFKTCEVLHLRQHYNFCSLSLNQTLFSNKSKKSQDSYFNVIELVFDEQTFGTITVCNQVKSDIKTYLYKLQNSDNQIMKLVGEASKLSKKQLFFDCLFQEQRYYLFIQSSNPNSVVSFMGESRPEIKIKEQILSNGLRNQSIEYLPVLNYEGLEAQKSIMARSTNFNFYSSKFQQTKKLQSMDDLREMFIELLIEEKRRK